MKNIWAMYFSPTGSTANLVNMITGAVCGMIDADEAQDVDFTPAYMREKKLVFTEDDLIFIGLPTYAGRLPNKIMPFVAENLKGNGAYAVPMVTYGNRSFDDSLAELADLLEGAGFKLLGGGAFPCQHAFAETLAAGRPDMMDMLQAMQLGEGALQNLVAGKVVPAKDFPGNHPVGPYYVPKKTDGEPAKFLKAVPKVDGTKCTACGLCATVCPMDSIAHEEGYPTTGICIKCQACIKKCPAKARAFDDEAFLSHRQMLMDNYAGERKEVQLVL